MIAFVLAMRDEAQPLIAHLGLQPLKHPTLFPVFHAEATWLTISGVGKANAAAAVTALYHVAGQTRDGVWLNVGIAGHPYLPLGELRSAHRIEDAANEQRWYPPQALLQNVASTALASVDTPETAYPQDCLYDMEGAGFYPTAVRCSTAEAVQCLKIVSDNATHGTERLTPQRIHDLIADKVDEVVAVGTELQAATRCLRRDEARGSEISALLAGHPFSATQRQQMMRLAQRLAARAPGEPLLDEAVKRAGSCREVLRILEQRVDALAVFPSADDATDLY